MYSLSARLLLSVSLLLVVFFGATIAVLDYAFRSAGEEAEESILDGHLMQLLAAAQPDVYGGLTMPPDLPEPRFGTIGSGLYAEMRDGDGNVLWQSRSALGLTLTAHRPPPPGEPVFARETLSDGTPVLALRLAVEWEFPNGELRSYVFEVLESLDSFHAQVAEFRRQLFTWFAALAALLLIAIALLQRRLLRPLRRIENEIGEIERGTRKALTAELPTELAGVARNLNVLIETERGRSERYRKTLDNLAHSLKTPLAAMRSLFRDSALEKQQKQRLDEQVQRMDDIVRYQLRKPASVEQPASLLAQIDVNGEATRLVEGLSKVYAANGIRIEKQLDPRAALRGDKGDFLELLGNLLDNACKWAGGRVRLSIEPLDGGGISISVEDDGPGIPAESREALLQRGVRLDEATPGHGIGLAIVKDLVDSYRGQIAIEESPLGGAAFRITLPQ